MAGNLKPDVPGLGKEASYVVNGYHFYGSNYPQCPLLDGKTSGWNGGSDAIWFTDADYLDITIGSAFNVYKLSVVGWNDELHQTPLTIWKLEKGWVNVTDRYPQKFNAAPTTWTKTMINMPRGRYKFTQGKYRLDGEWYIEKARSNQLYLKDDIIYGMQNDVFTKLNNDWTAITDADKKALFLSTNYEVATASDLSTLGKFKVLTYAETDDKPILSLTAVPHDQLVTPNKLIRIESYDGIDKATIASAISGNGACKIIVTTDLTTYQTYDFTNKEWQPIDHTDLTAVKAFGINATALQTIDRTAWDLLTTGKSGIGFAYFLSIDSASDTCAVDKLTLQVDMRGSWDKAVHGTDYGYGYPYNTTLRVDVKTNGDYKINYCGGV